MGLSNNYQEVGAENPDGRGGGGGIKQKLCQDKGSSN